MCSRFNQQITSAEMRRIFDAVGDITEGVGLRYNTAPTQTVAAITGANPRG